MTKKRVVIGVVIVAVVGVVAFAATRGGEGAPPDASSAPVVSTRVEEWVRASGHVEPSVQVRISANVTGRLMALHVREGEQVEKDAVLAEIDLGPMQAVLRQREANLSAARSALAGEQANVENLERELAATRSLRTGEFASASELSRISTTHRVAVASLGSARFRVQQALAEHEEMKSRLGESKLVAPVAGTVISLEKKLGERIRGSDMNEDVLLVLAPLDAMELEVTVTEQDVVNLEIGALAQIEMPALDLGAIEGKIAAIASSATVRDRGTALETTRFVVKLSFARVPERLRPGMTAQVRILARAKDKVLAVPFESVASRSRQVLERAGVALSESVKAGLAAKAASIPVVFVVKDGRAEARPVKTGLAGDRVIEVVEGVSEGEQVLTGPYELLHQYLEPGAAVRAWPSEEATVGPTTAAQVAP